LKEKNAKKTKVPPIIPDKGAVGKIRVRKGGARKSGSITCLTNINLTQIINHWQESQNKNLEEEKNHGIKHN
jgi:hypothetical protein